RTLRTAGADDLQRAVRYHLSRADEFGPKCGTAEGAGAVVTLSDQIGNVESAILIALNDDILREEGIRAACSLAEFERFTGLGTSLPLERALIAADLLGLQGLRARVRECLGDIALARSDHDGARQRFEEARPLYHRVGNMLSEANCIKGLGDIALAR